MVESIADPDDPRVEPYRFVRERDLVGRDGRFVAEGQVVIEVALARGRFPLESLLLAEDRLAAQRPLIAAAEAKGVPVYAAAPKVMDTIAGFPIHRGLIAIGRRTTEPEARTLLAGLDGPAIVVGLVGIANHDNMGGIFRNAAAFGASAVLIDGGSCDPLYRKAIRVSVGGALVVPFARIGDAADLPELAATAGFETLALTPSGDDVLARLDPPARSLVLFGAEGPGLPAGLIAAARGVRIPMADFDSLNVATTSGIVLHHLASRRDDGRP